MPMHLNLRKWTDMLDTNKLIQPHSEVLGATSFADSSHIYGKKFHHYANIICGYYSSNDICNITMVVQMKYEKYLDNNKSMDTGHSSA